MSQYHRFCAEVADGVWETADPYRLGSGATLREQARCLIDVPGSPPPTTPVLAAIGLEVMCGAWRGCRLVVVGDYAEGPDWALHASAREAASPFAESSSFGTGPVEVRDATPRLLERLAEATGIEVRGSGWGEVVHPADRELRLARSRAAARLGDPGLVLAAPHAGEYIDPAAFGAPSSPELVAVLGWAWPAAFAMLAVSDGAGAGDWRLSPAGRWAHGPLVLVSRRQARGLRDVTGWVRAAVTTAVTVPLH